MEILFLQKWEKNMDISNESYKIFFTDNAILDMNNIFEYISKKLYLPNSARRLMKEINDRIENLKYMPKIYNVIKKNDLLENEYRKIVIKNYVIIYTINEYTKTVYIANLYYSRSNYFSKI